MLFVLTESTGLLLKDNNLGERYLGAIDKLAALTQQNKRKKLSLLNQEGPLLTQGRGATDRIQVKGMIEGFLGVRNFDSGIFLGKKIGQFFSCGALI